MKRRTPARRLPLAALLAGFFLCCAVSVAAAAATDAITDYQVVSRAALGPEGNTLLVTRSLRRDGVPLLLAVDPHTFRTALYPPAQIRMLPSPPSTALAGTPFENALALETAPPYRLQNQGARHALGRREGIFLTVDLCPSRRAFERELFETTAHLPQGKGVPVAVMITGAWLEHHPEEVAYLKEAARSGRIAVTWVNHSYHHVYAPRVPLASNFLLTPGTDFDAEVLDTERLLLENGIVPSPFFRFPGLVSDERVVRRLRELSLIPIGSDAWLAKGEAPSGGSIVLVHGNGNEPKGIALALPLLRSGRWRLLPLADAFTE